MKDRYLKRQIEQDLEKKMVFVSGPRQVGKSTIAKQLLDSSLTGYLNWDTTEGREQILKGNFPISELIVFDEIHKYLRWRNYLKGIYDSTKRNFKILVTGSAKLDVYRRGGDSLQGRYHHLRLHPLSLKELGSTNYSDLESLFRLGGFPEPFFGGNEVEARRWSKEYRSLLVREEIASLEDVHDLGTMELLMMRLPELVGSPLSINSLREDLQVSHKTMARWLNIFENLYAIFRLSPLGAPKLKAVKKEQKHYLFDWTQIQDEGYRFENLVGSNLLKWVHFREDTLGEDLELRYFRDVTGQEIDFAITLNRSPILFVECKLSETAVAPTLTYISKKFPKSRCVQVHLKGNREYTSTDGIEVISAVRFLGELI